MSKHHASIASLNDEFRRSGKGVLLTPGVQALADVPGLVAAVREYSDFTKDNDPHGEHDFGSLVWRNHKIFWKIDYYDQAYKYWCDPLSPECNRVLTIMLASEY